MLVSMEEYEEGGHSVCRNPILQKMFVFLGIGERGGSGADIIAKGWLDNGWNKLPTLRECTTPDRVETTLLIPNTSIELNTKNIVSDKPAITSDKSEIASDKPAIKRPTIEYIYNYVASHPNCKTVQVAKYANLSETQTRWYLRQLVEAGRLTSNGANKNRTYSIVTVQISE